MRKDSVVLTAVKSRTIVAVRASVLGVEGGGGGDITAHLSN